MTTPTLALGISAVGAAQVAELAKNIGQLRSNLAELAATSNSSSTGSFDKLAGELTRMRREAAVAIQGLRTDLAEGFAKAYAGAAKEVREGGDKVAAEVQAAKVKVRAAGQGVSVGGGVTLSTSGQGLGSASAVAAMVADLQKLPEAQAATNAKMIAEQVAFEGKQKALWVEHLAALNARMTTERTMMDQTVAQYKAAKAAELAAQVEFENKQKVLYVAHQNELLARAAKEKAMVNTATASTKLPYSSISTGSFGELRNVAQDAENASRGMGNLTNALVNAHSAARGLASGFGAMWLTWGNIVPLLAGAAISHSFVQIVKMGSEVQHTFETIRVLSEETTGSISKLSEQMDSLARTGPFGPREIAEAMKTLSLAGLDAKQVGAAIQDVLNFSIAGTTSIAQAADVLTSVGAAFRITADHYGVVSDIIAKAAAVSKSGVEDMSNAFKSASTVNALYGVSLKDVGVNLALLSNIGIKGSAAGTALTNMYIDLAGRTPKATKALKELGVEALDTTGKMKDLGTIFGQLLEKLGTKTNLDQIKYINDIFAQRSRKDVLAIIEAMRTAAREGGEGLKSEFERINKEISESAGFSALAAVQMMQTPLNQMKSVVATLQADLVEAFTGVEPHILRITQQLKEIFNSNEFREGLRVIATAFAALISVTITLAEKLTWLATKFPPIAVAAKAWQLYAEWTGKSKDSTEAMAGTFDATIEGLKKEYDRLVKINEAKAEGISLTEKEARVAFVKAQADAQAPVEDARKIVKGLELQNAYNVNAGKMSAMQFKTENDALAKAKERLALEEKIAASKVQQLQSLTAAIKAEAAKSMAVATKPRDPNEAGTGTRADQVKLRHGLPNDNDLATLKAQLKLEEAAFKDSYDTQRQLLEAKHKGGLISEGGYFAELIKLTDDYESKSREAIQRVGVAELEEYRQQVARARATVDPKDLPQVLENLKNKYTLLGEEGAAALKKIDNDTMKRQALAVTEHDAALIKLMKSEDDYWAKANEAGNKEENLSRIRRESLDLTDAQRASLEASSRVFDSHQVHIENLKKKYDEAVFALNEFDRRMEGTAETADSAEKFRTMSNTVRELARALNVSTEELAKLMKQAGDTAAINANAEQLRNLAKEATKGLADGIMEAGQDGGKKLWAWLKDYFIKQPIRVILEGIMKPIGNMMGSFTQSMMNGMTGSAVGSTLGGMAGFAGGMSDTMRNFLSADSFSNIATLFEGGSFMGALGAAIPYIGAAVAIISMFTSGGGGPKTEGGYAPGGLSISGRDIGGNQQGSVRGDVANAKSISEGISNSWGAIASQLGLVNKKLDVGIFYAMDNAEGGTSLTQLQVTSKNYNRSNRTGGIENVPRGDDALKKELADETVRVIYTELLNSDLAPKFKTYLKQFDVSGDAAVLNNAIQTIASVNKVYMVVGSLSEGFDNLKDASVETIASIAELSGGFDNLGANLQTYYQNYFSESERVANTTKNVSDALASVGYAMPKTRDEFRALVESLNLNTEEGKKAYAVFMQVSGAFASFTPALQEVKNTVTEVVQVIDDATTHMANQGDIAIDLATQWRNAAEAWKSEQSKILNDLIDGYNKTLSAMKGYLDGLLSFKKELTIGPLAANSPEEQYNKTKAEFDRLSALPITDTERLEKLPDAGRAFLEASKAYNATSEAYFRDLARVMGSVDASIGATQTQITLTQALLDVAKHTLETLGTSAEYLRLISGGGTGAPTNPLTTIDWNNPLPVVVTAPAPVLVDPTIPLGFFLTGTKPMSTTSPNTDAAILSLGEQIGTLTEVVAAGTSEQIALTTQIVDNTSADTWNSLLTLVQPVTI